jgi:hypothetical protein
MRDHHLLVLLCVGVPDRQVAAADRGIGVLLVDRDQADPDKKDNPGEHKTDNSYNGVIYSDINLNDSDQLRPA